MIRIIQVVFVLSILTGCVNTKQPTIRETAISLIEKNYQVDGRRLEYSQIDSTDAELQGYFIGRIYINDDDSIKCEVFHLNYSETKVKVDFLQTLNPTLYKSLLINDKIFTDDLKKDIDRIIEISATGQYYDRDKAHEEMIARQDSIAAAEAIVEDFLKSLE